MGRPPIQPGVWGECPTEVPLKGSCGGGPLGRAVVGPSEAVPTDRPRPYSGEETQCPYRVSHVSLALPGGGGGGSPTRRLLVSPGGKRFRGGVPG